MYHEEGQVNETIEVYCHLLEVGGYQAIISGSSPRAPKSPPISLSRNVHDHFTQKANS
jgi:hypothetical protein